MHDMDMPITLVGNTYADGEPRPLSRGFIHLVGSALIVLTLLVVLFLIAWLRDARLWLLVAFLAGKLFSYAWSSFLHKSNITARCQVTHALVMKIDYIAVGVSIFATGIPVSLGQPEVYYGFSTTYLCLIVMATALNQNLARVVITVLHTLTTILFIGENTGWNLVWIAGSVFYVASFVCFAPVTLRPGNGANRQDSTLSFIPWHKKGTRGCHEDFHALLLLADACYFVVGARCL